MEQNHHITKNSALNIAKNAKLPIRLKIPKIHINSAVQYVGLTPDGAMDVPSNATDVGWYKLGPRPGETGNAVIDGHLDGKNGEAGVFANLHLLSAGDKIFIVDGKGNSTTFIVHETRNFNPVEDTDMVFNQSVGRHLNLITCDGVWNNKQGMYTKRLVVFSDASH